MDNAARHTKSTIMVGMEQRSGEVVVSVDNDGEIISPKDRSRVFERFARLDASRSADGGGSGLGPGERAFDVTDTVLFAWATALT
jgi:signal transduction histidine kinase